MSSWIKRSGAALAAATAATVIAPTAQAVPAADLAEVKTPIFTTPLMNYQVKPGDTLSEIAKRTGTSVDAIVRENQLRSAHLIFPGQQLRIPSPVTAKSAATKPAATKPAASKPAASKPAVTTYVVQRGDTLSKIALQHKTTVAKIAADNKISNPNRISVGQKLTIGGAAPATATPAASSPAATKPAAQKPAASKPAASAGATYTVKAGDTLGKIALQHGTTVAKIAADNGIANPNRLSIGQRLSIGTPAVSTPAAKPAAAPKPATPAPATNGTVYTVRAGDTLDRIARNHGTTVAAIQAANSISNPHRISVGQKLTIGGASTPATSTSKPQLVTNNFPGYTYADSTVAAANENKHALVNAGVPSRAQTQQTIIQVANQMGVDPKLALAHAYVESGFDATAVSPANAIGTMQVIPSSGVWASQLVGRKLDLLDPYDNIVAGVAIIRSLHSSAANFDQAVAGYYQGLGGVQRNGMRPDTVTYVAKVKSAMARF